MHNALLISEVLGCIVDYLAEDTVRNPPDKFPAKDARKTGRRALAVLSRTCRALSEPALDALWRRLHSLEPLLLCLPTKASYDDATVDGALVWHFSSEDAQYLQYHPNQPPFSDEEWNIVLRYAPRVQELSLEYEHLSMKILQSLWFRTTLLLPNLRKLRWMYEDYTAIASIRLLLSPSLVHLHVWLDGGDHSSVLGFLECYHTLCPNLKSLHFGHLCRFPHVTAAISRAISRSPNLESLGCDPINEAALIHIAESRCLKKFNASLLNYQPDDLRSLASHVTPDHPPFENLRVLELRVEDLSSIIPYLASHHQPFEEVSFDFRMYPPSEVFHEFFTALSSPTRRKTLRRIRLLCLGLRRRRHGLGSSQLVTFQVLSPLMTFNLRELDVNINNPVSLNDDELVRLVQAWPELDTFNFNQCSGWDIRPSFQIPTLRGLLLLLARCPKLRDLGLCFDARNIPSLSGDESSIRNTAIARLSVGNSPIQGPIAGVAHFLIEHLPSLIALPSWTSFSGKSSLEYRQMWRQVDKQIREILGRASSSSSESSDSEM